MFSPGLWDCRNWESYLNPIKLKVHPGIAMLWANKNLAQSLVISTERGSNWQGFLSVQ